MLGRRPSRVNERPRGLMVSSPVPGVTKIWCSKEACPISPIAMPWPTDSLLMSTSCHRLDISASSTHALRIDPALRPWSYPTATPSPRFWASATIPTCRLEMSVNFFTGRVLLYTSTASVSMGACFDLTMARVTTATSPLRLMSSISVAAWRTTSAYRSGTYASAEYSDMGLGTRTPKRCLSPASMNSDTVDLLEAFSMRAASVARYYETVPRGTCCFAHHDVLMAGTPFVCKPPRGPNMYGSVCKCVESVAKRQRKVGKRAQGADKAAAGKT